MEGIPPARKTDAEDVVWALQTADALWKRNERVDAIVWLRRAAQAAGEADDDERAVALARNAAELTELLAIDSSTMRQSAAAHDSGRPAATSQIDDLLRASASGLTAELAHEVDEARAAIPPEAPALPRQFFPADRHEDPYEDAPTDHLGATEDQPRDSVPHAEQKHAGMLDPWSEPPPAVRQRSSPSMSIPIPERAHRKSSPPPPPAFVDEEVVTSARTVSAPAAATFAEPNESPTRPKARAVSESDPGPSIRRVEEAPPAPPPSAKAPVPPWRINEEGVPVSKFEVVSKPPPQRPPPVPPTPARPPPLPKKPPLPPRAAAPPPPPHAPPPPPAPPPPAPPKMEAPTIEPPPPIETPLVAPPPRSKSAPSKRNSDIPGADSRAGRGRRPLRRRGVRRSARRRARVVRARREGQRSGEGRRGEPLRARVRDRRHGGRLRDDGRRARGRLRGGSVLRSRGSIEDQVSLRLICASDTASVAVWGEDAVAAAFKSCPWVEEDLRAAANRAQALAGVTVGPLGERLDRSLRDLVMNRLDLHVYAPGDVIVAKGKPVPGLVVVGVGDVELADGDTVKQTLGSGDFLFADAVLGGGAAPLTARAGKGGALLMSASRAVAQELLVTCPPLLELFAGM